jgi:hypothetical protein
MLVWKGKPNRRSEEEKDGRERNDQSLARSPSNSFLLQIFICDVINHRLLNK